MQKFFRLFIVDIRADERRQVLLSLMFKLMRTVTCFQYLKILFV